MNYAGEEIQRALKQEWKNYLEGNRVENVRPEIIRQWDRCKSQGVDPFTRLAPVLEDNDEWLLRLEKNKNLISVSRPAIQYLYQFMENKNYTVSISDSDGYLLLVSGNDYIVNSAMTGNGVPGADWSEKGIGNNPIGTAIVENRALQVFGYEHFCLCTHKWSGSGAPIHDPAGNIIGAISICGENSNVHYHTLGMAVMTSYAIEKQLKILHTQDMVDKESIQKNVIVDSISEGLIVIDKNKQITLANNSFLSLFNTDEISIIRKNIATIINDKMLLNVINNNVKATDYLTDIRINNITYPCVVTYNPIESYNSGVLIISDIKRAKKLAKKIVESQVKFTFNDIIGTNKSFTDSLNLARAIADIDSNVLLLGESGTGKDVFAQAIHNSSKRKFGKFVSVNCAAIPKDLINSELFGYDEGAFTSAKKDGNKGKFELANEGTIFLDEIGEMPLEMQAVLLRVIEQKVIYRLGGQEAIPVNVRIIAATNKDLLAEVKENRFRQDLYYRLNVLSIRLIPLRERKDDIELLVSSFIKKLNSKYGKSVKTITPELMELLINYNWPGNIRELQNAIERGLVLAKTDTITVESMPFEIVNTNLASNGLKTIYQQYEKESAAIITDEKQSLMELLNKHRWNLTKVSLEMQISRSTLYRKIKQYELNK